VRSILKRNLPAAFWLPAHHLIPGMLAFQMRFQRLQLGSKSFRSLQFFERVDSAPIGRHSSAVLRQQFILFEGGYKAFHDIIEHSRVYLFQRNLLTSLARERIFASSSPYGS
jgi:hypothetical protein